MKTQREAKISYWAAHLTTVVSVTLLLLIIGIIALAAIGADRETRRLRSRIELNAVMTDSVSEQQTQALADWLRKRPYTAGVRVVTSKEAMKNWKDETGEDLEQLFGVNILSPEVSFTLKPEYTSSTQLKKIEAETGRQPGVEAVAMPDADIVDSMNANLQTLALILGTVALVLVIISFVLINNTVHLSIYSRRFTIHTMQLVGATNGFIRRPFVGNNLLSGVLAGVLASGILAASLAGADRAGLPDIASFVPWGAAGIVFGGLVVTGAIICSLAACLATTKYLRKDYDELFR